MEQQLLKALKQVTNSLFLGNDLPQDPRPPCVPKGGTAVSITAWRNRAYALPISDGHGESARRKAFLRARQGLKIKGLVDFSEEWAWLAGQD